MTAALQSKLEEISLLLVMTSEGDPAGIELLSGMLEELAASCAEDADSQRIKEAVAFCLQYKSDRRFLALLGEFTSSAQELLSSSGTPCFPHEREQNACSAPSQEGWEDLQVVDHRFLTEFIETHLLSLEDFEGQLMDLLAEGSAEAEKAVKGYLHSLKGDAGSIGLKGIQQLCHSIEDLLTERPPSDLIAELLKFKEWMVETLRAFKKGEREPQSAKTFFANLLSNENGSASSLPVTSSPKSSEKPAPLQPTPASPASAPSSASYTITGESDILTEFATEAEEHLNNVESVILEAEGNFSKDAVDKIFRGVHSIKGGSAYFNLQEMISCSHILENFLSEVRDGSRQLDQRLSDLLLTYIDLQKGVLARARASLPTGGAMVRAAASDEFLSALEAYRTGAADLPAVSKSQALPAEATRSAHSKDNSPHAAPSMEAAKPETKENREADMRTFVKVDTARLDHLIDAVGEMVIYSSMLIRLCRGHMGSNQRAMDISQRVEKFSRELQDVGMSMRLVPIKGLFQKMSRLVWDTSKKLGKQVDFYMEGEDTELDRNLIDKLADPLMHMVRNSLDHGVETPEERLAKGKSAKGCVKLSAAHSGGSIHIRIEDDGKGLNPEKLIAKAIEKGIVAPGERLSDQEAFQLIFAAGFSTAAQVTDISGRGVGMDVVRRNVESLRGRIHIESEVGKGSAFTIELPLTLAILDGIQVRVGNEHFIVPSLSVIEFIKPSPAMLSNTLDSGETFHFRGKYLPLFRLAELYEIEPLTHAPYEGTVLVVESNHDQVALLVDDVEGQYSTVIKSLGSAFEGGKGFAGCAIMADGEVALILDLRSLIELARTTYTRKSLGHSSAELAGVVH